MKAKPTTPKRPRPRKHPAMTRIPILSHRKFETARRAGIESSVLVGELIQAIQEFMRAARIDVDAQRIVLELSLREVEDRIDEDSVSWSDARTAIAPHMKGRSREA